MREAGEAPSRHSKGTRVFLSLLSRVFLPWLARPLTLLSTKFSHLPPRQLSERITRQNERGKGSATPICILLSIVDL